MDTIATYVARSAAIDHSLPGGITGRIGFAIQKVEILLPHKESSAINRVGPVCGLVVLNGCRRRVRRAQGEADGVAQRYRESFITFRIRIIDNRNGDVFRGFTDPETRPANRSDVVATCRSLATDTVSYTH